MYINILFTEKLCIAFWACKNIFMCVLVVDMPFEVALLSETLSAFGTLEWSIPGMHPHMNV
jgi:hypothetical protein